MDGVRKTPPRPLTLPWIAPLHGVRKDADSLMGNHSRHRHDPDSAAGALSATDPVCGVPVGIAEDTRSRDHGDETFHFCSDGCQEKFDADPCFYASGNAGKAAQRAQPGTQCTCPMHPEIVRDEPGASPRCGMALEPMVPLRNLRRN